MPNEFVEVWRRQVKRRIFLIGFTAGAAGFWLLAIIQGINPKAILNAFGVLAATGGTATMGLLIGLVGYAIADAWTLNVQSPEKKAMAAAFRKFGGLKS